MLVNKRKLTNKSNILIVINKFLYIFLIIFFLIIVAETLGRSSITNPLPSFKFQNPIILITFALIQLSIIFLIHHLSKKIFHFNERKVVFIILFFYVILQTIIVLISPDRQVYDPKYVIACAKQISMGDFSCFDVGQYLNFYPNNIGISLIYAFLFTFLPKSIMVARIVNIIFSTLTALIIYKICKNFISSKNAYSVLILTVLFTPVLILNNRTYNDVISTMFCTLAIYLAMKFTATKKYKFMVFTALSLMVGNFVRGSTLLFLAGILFYWFMNGILCKKQIKDQNDENSTAKKSIISKKFVIGIVFSVMIFNMPMQLFSYFGQKFDMLDEPVGTHENPVWRWVNIGLPYNSRLGYWDNGRNAKLFLKDFKSDPKKASVFFKNDIKNKFKEVGVATILKGYVKKTYWQWSIGSYSTFSYKEPSSVKIEDYTVLDHKLKSRATLETIKFYLLYLQSYNWLIFVFIILYLINSIKKKDYSQNVFFFTIIAYIGFYLIWEVKPRYLYGLYPFFLLISSNAVIVFIENKLPFCIKLNKLVNPYANLLKN